MFVITNSNLAAVHGYLCSDGYVAMHKPGSKNVYYHVGLRNTNIELLKDFQIRFTRIFGVQPKISKDRCHKNSKTICISLLEKYGSFHSREWKLPQLSREVAQYWLRAFFDSEGWVTAIDKKSRVVSAESVNKQGLIDIGTIMLEIFGITTSIQSRKGRQTHILRIFGKENIRKYDTSIGFLHPEKNSKLQRALKSYDHWKWEFPENPTINYLRTLKFSKRKNSFRIHSRKENLQHLQEILKNSFNINTVLYKSKNGQGVEYHVLYVYGTNKDRLRQFLV